MVWWGLAVVACVGWCVSSLVREGSGHEIFLEGEVEVEEGAEEGEGRVGERKGRRGKSEVSARPGYVREVTQSVIR